MSGRDNEGGYFPAVEVGHYGIPPTSANILGLRWTPSSARGYWNRNAGQAGLKLERRLRMLGTRSEDHSDVIRATSLEPSRDDHIPYDIRYNDRVSLYMELLLIE